MGSHHDSVFRSPDSSVVEGHHASWFRILLISMQTLGAPSGRVVSQTTSPLKPDTRQAVSTSDPMVVS